MFKFATWLVGWIGTLGAFFAKYLTRRFAVTAAFVAALVAMTLALFVAVKGLVIAVALSITNPYILLGFTAVMPANAPLLLSAYVSSRVIWWAYNFNRDTAHFYFGGV